VEVPTVPTLDSEGNYHDQVATANYLLRDRRRIAYTIPVQPPLELTTYHDRLCESHASNMIVQELTPSCASSIFPASTSISLCRCERYIHKDLELNSFLYKVKAPSSVTILADHVQRHSLLLQMPASTTSTKIALQGYQTQDDENQHTSCLYCRILPHCIC